MPSVKEMKGRQTHHCRNQQPVMLVLAKHAAKGSMLTDHKELPC